jgi:uncharacterized Zn-binding protein involved in type VI secretion
MSGATRVGDGHVCGASHVGGQVLPPGSTDVTVNGVPVARATDRLACAGPGSAPDFIVTGALTVRVNGLPIARQFDTTMHGAGILVGGSSNVMVGGPSVGVALGNDLAGQTRFWIAAQGRRSKSVQQSYGNCGVESVRQIIQQATGSSIEEDALLYDAIAHGDAAESDDRSELGGTRPGERQALLARHNVPSSLQPNRLENIVQAVAEGKGVISSNEVSVLWGQQRGGHAVVVSGLTYDDSGELTNVIINDTGSGEGSRRVPAAQFEDSLRWGTDANVTDAPIW